MSRPAPISLVRLLALSFALLLGGIGLPSSALAQDYDLLIRGGQVYDGTGNPAFHADVAVDDGKIAAVGMLEEATADRVIDAEGLHVSPGFIDIHSHADGPWRTGLRADEAQRRAAPSLVTQGITTVVVNQDGRSEWPLTPQIEELQEKGHGPHAIVMAGHGSLRREVMGEDVERPATAEEVDSLRALAREAMQQGAFGLSAGLEYAPGRWAETEEVVAMVDEIAPYDGAYISHQRSEGSDPMWYWPSQHESGAPTLLDAVLETIEIGEKTGATVVASHIKAKGAHYWGSSQAAIQLIQRARDRGVDVWADQYSYRSTGTDGSTVLIPHWLFDEEEEDGDGDDNTNYAALLEEALADPEMEQTIRRDIEHEIYRRGGPGELLILDHPDEEYVGLTLREVADRHSLSPVDAALHLQQNGDPEEPGGARLRGFSMSEDDVEAYMQQPWVAAASDGGIGVAEVDDGFTHPRFYGNVPRKISHYAMEREVLSVADAIRSATSLPAQIMGLQDRGLIREGAHADLAIMDLDRLEEKATFEEPHQYSEGVEYVLVGGEFVVEEGDPTGALSGTVIQNPLAEQD